MGKRNFSTHLSGQIGESLVVAELGRRGIVATAFSGNVPDIDLLAYRNGKTLHLQVKAWRSGDVSFHARRFLDIEVEGSRQSVRGIVQNLDADLIYVFVRIGEKAGSDRFFVLRQGELAAMLRAGYSRFLERHGGVRPRNPSAMHTAVNLQELSPFEDNWNLIERRL